MGKGEKGMGGEEKGKGEVGEGRGEEGEEKRKMERKPMRKRGGREGEKCAYTIKRTTRKRISNGGVER